MSYHTKIYLFFFVVIPGVVIAASVYAATLSLSPSSQTVNVDDVFSVDIVLDTQGASVDGVDIVYLNYNPSLLSILDDNGGQSGVQITPGSLMPITQVNSVNNSTGRLQFSQITASGGSYTGSGVLATLRFRALAAGSANATFNFTVGSTVDTNVASSGSDVLTGVTNGTYSLSSTGGGSDVTAPSAVGNLNTSNVTTNSIQLSWTAPGDDGTSGTASSYDIRRSTSVITSSNWSSATQVSGEPSPLSAGNAQSMTVSGLSSNTLYYFAMRTSDEAGNVSALSNVVSATTQSPAANLSVSLTATPDTGTDSLFGVDLTATVSGTATGGINYTFYCDRSDSGTNITTPIDASFTGSTQTTRIALDICGYSSVGTYTGKVIVERGGLFAENRTTITVTSSGGGGGSGGSGGGGGGGGGGTPPNTPPFLPASVGQFTQDGLFALVESGTTNQSGATFKAVITDPDNDFARFKVEIRKTTEAFVGFALVDVTKEILQSNFRPSGSTHSVTVTGLPVGNYKWRYQVIDNQGNVSTWREFGIAGNTDFIVAAAGTTVPPSSTAPPTFPTTSGSGSGSLTCYKFTRDLSVGSRGEDVEALQEILVLEGVYPEAITSGYFGNLTKAAVVRFQEKYSISPTSGYVGSLTRAKLTGLYGTCETPLPSSPPVSTPTVVSCVNVTPISVNGPFGIGMRSEQVRILQQMLKLDPTIYPEGLTTGYYGTLTTRAIERFQVKYGIISSGAPYSTGYGLAGPSTRVKVNEIFGLQLATKLCEEGALAVDAGALLKFGSRGDAVKALQSALNQLGFDVGAADGIFGSKTFAGVKSFQAAHSLLVDGIAGPQTNGKLKEVLGN